jgi:hypothetical protein
MSLTLMFALAFPIEPPVGESVFAVEIPAAAYATLTTGDLRDLAVVDAQGRPQTISLLRPAPRRAEAPQAIPLPLPLALPPEAREAAGGLQLHLSQDSEGRVAHLDLSSGGPARTPAGEEWLLDLAAASEPGYDGLRVEPVADSGDFRVLVDLRGSDDLVTWSPIAEALPLLRVSDGGRTVERLDLRFPRSRFRHLALNPSTGSAPLPRLVGLAALRQGDWQPPAERLLTLEASAGDAPGMRFTYAAPGPLPVTRVAVRVAEPNAVHEFTLRQGSGEDAILVLSGTAWQFDVGGRPLRSPPQDLGLPGLGALHLALRHPAQAPGIELHYVPEQVVVVASGQPPYRLLAGSAGFRNAPVPMGDALAGLRAIRGADWVPPVADLGPAQTAAGAAALEPVRAIDRGRMALWGALGLGVLLVGGLAWRLLREAPKAA